MIRPHNLSNSREPKENILATVTRKQREALHRKESSGRIVANTIPFLTTTEESAPRFFYASIEADDGPSLNGSPIPIQPSVIQAGNQHHLKPFPQILMEILSKEEDPEIISWLPSGNAFIIKCPKLFVDRVLPKFFHQTKLSSFQRQLNMYGFQRIAKGPELGAYMHNLFRRDKPKLCSSIRRRKTGEDKINDGSGSDLKFLEVMQNMQGAIREPSSHGKSECARSYSLSTEYTKNPNVSSSNISGTDPSFVTYQRTAPFLGYSIVVCDHWTKTAVEVANYPSLPDSGLESFASNIRNLLAAGVDQKILERRISMSKGNEIKSSSIGRTSAEMLKSIDHEDCNFVVDLAGKNRSREI